MSAKGFSELLSFFPIQELPLTLQYGDLHEYGKSNDPIPDELLIEYIIPNAGFEIDEFTEFLPCFQFKAHHGIHHLVFWSGRLMHYAFHLANFDVHGKFIEQKEIAGFYTKENKVLQKMAHINNESAVYIVETNLSENENHIITDQTYKWMLELLPDGTFKESTLVV